MKTFSIEEISQKEALKLEAFTNRVIVGCATNDFAMQNVLLQKGLQVMNFNGFMIKKLKNFVLRCHACYEIVKDMEKRFCPTCGRNTLIKTTYSIDQSGQMKIYLKKHFQYNNRGTIVSNSN